MFANNPRWTPGTAVESCVVCVAARPVIAYTHIYRASCSWICHKQTEYWQCTALSTASEANATASENTELGGPVTTDNVIIAR